MGLGVEGAWQIEGPSQAGWLRTPACLSTLRYSSCRFSPLRVSFLCCEMGDSYSGRTIFMDTSPQGLCPVVKRAQI